MSNKNTLTPRERHEVKLQKAVDLLGGEIADNGIEMLGSEVYNEPQWNALNEVAAAIGMNPPRKTTSKKPGKKAKRRAAMHLRVREQFAALYPDAEEPMLYEPTDGQMDGYADIIATENNAGIVLKFTIDPTGALTYTSITN